MIGDRLPESTLLDLFAGTGAVGCEALSRGARSVHFVENSRTALKLIARNISLIPDGPSRSVIHPYNLGLGLPPPLGGADQAGRFDLIFADPPYGKGLSERILDVLDQSRCLHAGTLVIIEEKKRFQPKNELLSLYMIKERRYGDSVFYFYRPKPDDTNHNHNPVCRNE